LLSAHLKSYVITTKLNTVDAKLKIIFCVKIVVTLIFVIMSFT